MTHRRAAILLEALIAVLLFTVLALVVLTALRQSAGSTQRLRDTSRAADLARSAMAQIEAGLARPETLSGPASLSLDTEPIEETGAFDEDAIGGGFDEDPQDDSLWELEVETERSQFRNLSLVSVRALRRAAPGSEQVVADYTLRQLVRLGRAPEDTIGGVDGLMREAERGATTRRIGGDR